MRSRRRVTSSLFRTAANAPPRPTFRSSRGSANAAWKPGSVFSSGGVNVLILLAIVAAVLACLFVGIPKLVGDKKERETPRLINPSAPPERP